MDDQSGFLELLQRMMPEYEMRVESDPLAALKLARELQPDLFVIDLVMPGMRGTDLAATLRAMPQYAETPIFLLSGLVLSPVEDDEPVQIQGYPAFSKPFKIEVLKRHIGLHLSEPTAARLALRQLRPGFLAGA